MPKTCVILGAGASHDVWDRGSPITDARWKPPLAKDLFNIADNPAYWNILQIYPGAAALAQRLGPLIVDGDRSIEDELRKSANHHDHRIREMFSHVPPYLRDLMLRASKQYVPIPSCYVQLAIELLTESPNQVLFLVLNYDDLLESALHRLGSSVHGYQFTDIADYVHKSRQAWVLKVHGSIDWFVRMPNNGSDNWINSLRVYDVARAVKEQGILIRGGITDVKDYESEQTFLYPVITAPLAGKKWTDLVCPDSHIAAAKEFLSDCHKFLIIGTSAQDEDVLALLDEAIPQDTRPYVNIVDVGEGPDLALHRFDNGIRAFASSSANKIRINTGFRAYVSSEAFRTFAAHDPER